MHPEDSLSSFKLENTSWKQISGYPGTWVVLHREASMLGRPLDANGPQKDEAEWCLFILTPQGSSISLAYRGHSTNADTLINSKIPIPPAFPELQSRRGC